MGQIKKRVPNLLKKGNSFPADIIFLKGVEEMFYEESVWIGNFTASLNLTSGQAVLDVGSSTEKFRCLSQPYIDYYIFRPLRKRGVKIIHADAEAGEGVDVVFDFTSGRDVDGADKLVKADVVLCTNLLEHVRDRESTLRWIKEMVKPGGTIIISVPFFFPYHPHPIDTMYRPTNSELEKLFPSDEYSVMASTIIEAYSWPVWPNTVYYWGVRALRRISEICRLKLENKLPNGLPSKVSVVAVKRICEKVSYEVKPHFQQIAGAS
jgi:SAM-dependent methyltransferase